MEGALACEDSDAALEDEEEDAYADLESWYASSLPHLHSSASFAHMADAFCQRADASPVPATTPPQENNSLEFELDMDEEDSVDHYAIELDGPASPTPPEPTVVPGEKIASARSPHGFQAQQTLGEGDAFLEFVPKKLLASRRSADVVLPLASCCDRCRSDLNGKLLAKCATCAFRRHLYCFSPPLRQHPALVALAHVPRHKRRPMAQLMSQWRCDACVQRIGSAPSPEAPKRTTIRIDKPTQLPPRRKTKSPNKPPHKSTPPASTTFDWHEYRAAKLVKVLGADWEMTREEDDEPRSAIDELAFYSRSDALMRKTARFWQQHVHRRRQQRALAAARLRKCQFPVKRPLLVELSPREATEVDKSNQRRQEQEERDRRELFDASQFYRFDDPRPVFETLRWQPPPEDELDDGLSAEERERLALLDHERQCREQQQMAAEDDDAPTPAQTARIARRRAIAESIAKDPSLLGLYLAARIIERVCVKWLRSSRESIQRQIEDATAREREQLESELMAREENAEIRRRSHAQLLVRRLRFVVRFLVAMVRAQRRVVLKKELVRLLNDAKEDSQLVQGAPDAPLEDKVKKLAERRIQRFFLRRVRRYVVLNKRVMAWKISRWWKRRHYTYSFRDLAIVARSRRRECAARSIQRAFRQYCAYRTFRSLREKHILRRLRRFLRRWLMERVIKQERDRVAVFDAAAVVGARDLAPDATLPAILKAMGLVLYEQSDFWNGAAVLERLAKLDNGALDKPTRFALAYCHHMSWYASCDSFSLARTEEHYRLWLADHTAGPVDPFVLHEIAVVLMQREDFHGSLVVLGRLIELFRDDDAFPSWLLLAGVQLQQVGRFDESAAYLSYLSDVVLPSPYEERDVLALCAMSYELSSSKDGATSAKEAWRAAIRLWGLEKKLASVASRQEYSYSLSTTSSGAKQTRVSGLRKWELLVDLATRASEAGHFLIACRSLLYAIERLAPVTEGGDDADAGFEYEKQRAWWALGDAFRHVGRLELYVEATSRSRHEVSDAEKQQWRAMAESQATRMERELAFVNVMQSVAQIRAQYEGAQLEDCARLSRGA